jgi:hypothetical protein
MPVLRDTLEDGLQPGSVLKLFLRTGILIGLEGGDGVVGAKLGSHLGEN